MKQQYHGGGIPADRPSYLPQKPFSEAALAELKEDIANVRAAAETAQRLVSSKLTTAEALVKDAEWENSRRRRFNTGGAINRADAILLAMYRAHMVEQKTLAAKMRALRERIRNIKKEASAARGAK